jgi:hypothetical protein
MIDVENKRFWCIDWEMARFEIIHRDLEQMLTNLWVMKQDDEFYSPVKCDFLLRRLQYEYFGAEEADWREHCNEDTKCEFVLLTTALLAEDHIKKRSKQIILKAIDEVNSVTNKK